MNLWHVFIALVISSFLIGCSSNQTRFVEGSFPSKAPHFIDLSDQQQSSEHKVLLITATAGKQTQLKIIKINQQAFNEAAQGLVLPAGQYDFDVVLQDGEIQIPLNLKQITLHSGHRYLMNFSLNQTTENTEPASDKAIHIILNVTNLETNQPVYNRAFKAIAQ